MMCKYPHPEQPNMTGEAEHIGVVNDLDEV